MCKISLTFFDKEIPFLDVAVAWGSILHKLFSSSWLKSTSSAHSLSSFRPAMDIGGIGRFKSRAIVHLNLLKAPAKTRVNRQRDRKSPWRAPIGDFEICMTIPVSLWLWHTWTVAFGGALQKNSESINFPLWLQSTTWKDEDFLMG